MTIINGYKIEYTRKEPRIVKQDAATEKQIASMKRGRGGR